MYHRFVEPRIREALADTPVVLLVGPRRAGKTTLVRVLADGAIVGVEVKASATVSSQDFAGLRTLAGACGDLFAFGVVLYDGDTVVPFGERLAAAPVSSLWT